MQIYLPTIMTTCEIKSTLYLHIRYAHAHIQRNCRLFLSVTRFEQVVVCLYLSPDLSKLSNVTPDTANTDRPLFPHSLNAQGIFNDALCILNTPLH